ncbi:MAG: efflux RND transporter permease subunit [Alphaproteobacteria bacterium]
MNLTEVSLKRPTAVVAAVLLVVAFGLVALKTIPVQLTPDVRRPIIDIKTRWRGTAPAEIEREITNRIEEQLGGIEGVAELTSRSRLGQSRIRLEFDVGTDMDRALMLVGNRLSLLDDLPNEADEPVMMTRGSEDNPIAYFALLKLPGNDRNLQTYGEFVEDVIIDRLERVPGVAGADFRGGTRRELRVTMDPEKLARYRLTVPEVVSALRGASASISAGSVDEGKRRYLVRTEGEIRTAAQASAVVLRTLEDPVTGRISRVTVGDIAKVGFSYKERSSFRRYLGERTITLSAVRETGANVIETMKGLQAAVKDLNENILPSEKLKITQVYDETIYIKSAIGLVNQNIYLGGTLAALILILFLRSFRPTAIIALAIPVSVIGAFVAMAMLGRSINVISLAGIAFAIGMVVDAAIVVMENIFRHRQEGKSATQAALIGTREVWPAVLASALTTVVVFVPMLILELQIGQLFRDIAVALTVAVSLSLLVSVTVVPALSNRMFKGMAAGKAKAFYIPGIDEFASGFVRLIMWFTDVVSRRKSVAFLVVAAICTSMAWATHVFLPALDFLPDGNRNFIWGRIKPPPGYNLETNLRLANQIEDAVRPLWASVSGPESKEGEPPKIRHFFFVAHRDSGFIGASAVDPMRAGELIEVLEEPILREPGTRGSIKQSSLFSRGIGGSRSIRIDVSGPELEDNMDVARQVDDMLRDVTPRREGHRVRPRPGLELGAPEIRVVPNQLRLADAGITARELGQTLDAFNDGLRVREITVGDRRMDLVLGGPPNLVSRTQGIKNLPVVTKSGRIVPAESLADIKVTAGPSQIWHLERTRYVTLQVSPSKTIPLEITIDKIQKNIIDVLRKEGLPPGVKIRMSGAADNLTETWNAMQMNLLVAMIVVFLVMAVLLESFIYPVIIMLSVPLATAGGVLGLWILNRVTYQPLDMMTMLGFVILIGTVVNNAILLVTYTLQGVRNKGMTPAEAINMSTRTRIRPIFMSTLTTVFGMLPLVVLGGAGSELYRGLGAVIIGGLSLSAVLTLLIVPPLMSLFVRKAEMGKAMGAMEEAAAPGE